MGVDLIESLLAGVGHDLTAASPSVVASQLAVIVIVILGVGETASLAIRRRKAPRPHLLPEAAAAAVMGLGGLLIGLGLAGLFMLEFELVRGLAPTQASGFWDGHRWLGLATAFVAWDVVGYLYHRIGHVTAIGWAAHRPHHTGSEFTLSLAWRQSWLPAHAVVLPLVAIGGWSLSTIVICAAGSNVLQALQHTSAPVRLPAWIVAVFMTPQQHRHHHHRASAAAAAVNLGPVFTIWDRIAGTYVAGPLDEKASYGVDSATANPLRLQFEGWTELAGRGAGRSALTELGAVEGEGDVVVSPPLALDQT